MKASELIRKLQAFVDDGKDYEVWAMFWDEEGVLSDPEILFDSEKRIYL